MKKVTKAVIPAAGLGTRVLPATKAMPKGMLPLVDKPAIQYLVEEAVRSGITDILIILGRNQSIIEDHFDRSPELEEKLAKPGKEKMLEECLGIALVAGSTRVPRPAAGITALVTFFIMILPCFHFMHGEPRFSAGSPSCMKHIK